MAGAGPDRLDPTLVDNLPTHLRPLVKTLESDIRTHADQTDEIHAYMLAEHSRAKDAERTALEFSAWQDEQITLSAVAWVLGCVFVRFCEDNRLIAEPRLAGEGDRLRYATDETAAYFQQNPSHSDREYLLWVFERAAELPGMAPGSSRRRAGSSFTRRAFGPRGPGPTR